MDPEVSRQRREEATKARRKVFTVMQRDLSFFEQMDDAAKEEFFKKEKARSLKVRRRRKIVNNTSLTIGIIIACAVSILAIVPVFYTFLNSFMSSAEIANNYGVIFQSLSGHADQGVCS